MATKYFLDQEGVQVLIQQVLDAVNTRIADKIVVTTDGADDQHVLSAKAVMDAVAAAVSGVEGGEGVAFEAVTGAITTVDEPKNNIIYLQRDDEEDTTWVMYVRVADDWVSIGDTQMELTNVWTKDDTEEMEVALGVADLKTSVTELSEKVDGMDTVEAISTETITQIFNDVFANSAPEE